MAARSVLLLRCLSASAHICVDRDPQLPPKTSMVTIKNHFEEVARLANAGMCLIP